MIPPFDLIVYGTPEDEVNLGLNLDQGTKAADLLDPVNLVVNLDA